MDKMTITDIIVELIRDQTIRLKDVEKEIIKKHKNNEDFSFELEETKVLKSLIKEGVMELAREKQRAVVLEEK